MCPGSCSLQGKPSGIAWPENGAVQFWKLRFLWVPFELNRKNECFLMKMLTARAQALAHTPRGLHPRRVVVVGPMFGHEPVVVQHPIVTTIAVNIASLHGPTGSPHSHSLVEMYKMYFLSTCWPDFPKELT